MKTDQVETAAISAIAGVSKTPFRTAFKVAIGIAAAQLVVLLFMLSGLALVITAVSFAMRK